MPLQETVTIVRDVPQSIADLVRFARRLEKQHGVDLKGLTDDQLVKIARAFWDTQHGED
jgi:hypothetical protein